jgi:PIN domain nuclease of toxin-antitoxin system
MQYLLDACTLLAVFNGELGANIVLDLLGQARSGTVRLDISLADAVSRRMAAF